MGKKVLIGLLAIVLSIALFTYLSSVDSDKNFVVRVDVPTPSLTPLPTTDPAVRLAQMKLVLDACPLCLVHMDGALAGPPFGIPVAKGTLYSLQFMKVVQKVDGGYLIQAGAPAGGDMSTELAYLKTDAVYAEDTIFMEVQNFVLCTGTYEYQAVNGFNRKIWEFRPLNGDGNAYVMKRMQAAYEKQQRELNAASNAR